MSRLSAKLRQTENGPAHWCPACEEMHLIPKSWKFDGNVETPTFSPSVKITGKQAEVIDGVWTGEWVRDASGEPADYCCHYILAAGRIAFCGDCSHAFAGRTVPLPDLPPELS